MRKRPCAAIFAAFPGVRLFLLRGRCWAFLAGVLLPLLSEPSPGLLEAQAPAIPSFSCAHVTSQVNTLICTTPRLAQLDQELALVFNNMQGQPIDHKKLRTEEDAWITALHRDCTDVACIEDRYQTRLRDLRDTSLRAASPAAYDETRPFPVPEELRVQAAMRAGKSCTTHSGLVDASIPGFLPAPRFLPIFGPSFVIVVRQAGGHHFAFLLPLDTGKAGCLVRDVVALPSDVQASHFLQCSNVDPPITGFGVRSAGNAGLAAFWTVDKDQLRIERVAIKLQGIDRSVRCRQPESF